MLFDTVPFLPSDLSDEKLISMIKKKKVKFPPLKFLTKNNPISENCKDFMTRLLDKNPQTRLGAKNGYEEVFKHPWFEDINIDEIINKKKEPPYVPELTANVFDVENFDMEQITKPPRFSKVNAKTKDLIKGYKEKFDQFDS